MAGREEHEVYLGGATPEVVSSDKWGSVWFRNGASAEMNVLGTSGAPIEFEIAPSAAGKILIVKRIHFLMYIDSTVVLHNWFGGSNTARLANGILIQTINDPGGGGEAVSHDWLDGLPITDNGAFDALAGVDALAVDPAGNKGFIPVRWTLENDGAKTSFIDSEAMRITIQDDLRLVGAFKIERFRAFAKAQEYDAGILDEV